MRHVLELSTYKKGTDWRYVAVDINGSISMVVDHQ